ncbi:B-cell receptor CD22-like [Mytilus californianus]|uniref:B-cell receptor CD22-like n=1 Tax=Mytilus californianus TaxID=6549 RepID=UPI002246D914|nr:B-cell receptor CD22-like [Mytilus californianus]
MSSSVLLYIDPPVIFNIPDYTITEGSILHITPTIDANPQPLSVWWTRQNDTSYTYTGMNLTINNIQRESSDYYICNAMNTITTSSHSTQNRTTEKLFKVNVLYPPSVYMEPMYSPFIVHEDQQNIRLSCVVAKANPKDAIMYQWTYPAGIVRDGDLTITTVSKSHYGLYTCTASNSVGTSTFTTKQIDVHYEPVIDGIQDYNIEAGKTLTVTPTIDANPAPTAIWWTRENDISFIYHGLNLKITNIHKRDSNNYTCHVMNTLTPSGLSAQNITSITVFNINVQKISNEESVNGAAVGVGMGFTVILLTLGVTSLIILLYRKRRIIERKDKRPKQTSMFIMSCKI